MNIFLEKINEICKKNKKVAMFIDMDGTIVEYIIYTEEEMHAKGRFVRLEPLNFIIDKLKEINKINNIDLYILTLAKNSIIVNEKKEWLKENIKFINEERWIIINKEENEYNEENRNIIKLQKIKEKLKYYDYAILLDDDHKILKETQSYLKNKCSVYHISSAII